MPTERTDIEGYDYGQVGASPVTREDLRKLEQTLGFTQDDRDVLAAAGEILRPQAEALVDSWRAIIAAQPHLAQWFFRPDGTPDDDYRAAVKRRFVQWVVDLCSRPFDQQWLDYQQEIGLRHTPTKKNVTDGADTPAHVPLRYVLTFAIPVMRGTREYLQRAGVAGERLDRMEAAWAKAVILSLTLWSKPYTREGLW